MRRLASGHTGLFAGILADLWRRRLRVSACPRTLRNQGCCRRGRYYRADAGGVLVLFDMEGTLMGGSAETHLEALCDAVAAVTGSHPLFTVDKDRYLVGDIAINGMVDRQIIAVMLDAVSQPVTGALVTRVVGRVGGAYRRLVAAGHPVGKLNPGVAELLAWLAARGVRCGLATGNVHAAARAKIGAVGLTGAFSCGGFGDRAHTRSDVVAEAAHFARGEAVWHVGDTPADVDAALSNRVGAIAVTTGGYSRHELAGAAIVADRMDDPRILDAFDTALLAESLAADR